MEKENRLILSGFLFLTNNIPVISYLPISKQKEKFVKSNLFIDCPEARFKMIQLWESRERLALITGIILTLFGIYIPDIEEARVMVFCTFFLYSGYVIFWEIFHSSIKVDLESFRAEEALFPKSIPMLSYWDYRNIGSPLLLRRGEWGT